MKTLSAYAKKKMQMKATNLKLMESTILKLWLIKLYPQK